MVTGWDGEVVKGWDGVMRGSRFKSQYRPKKKKSYINRPIEKKYVIIMVPNYLVIKLKILWHFIQLPSPHPPPDDESFCLRLHTYIYNTILVFHPTFTTSPYILFKRLYIFKFLNPYIIKRNIYCF